MTKRYSILRKKLQELESKLQHASSLPPDFPFYDDLSLDIMQRLGFIASLLSAEIASHPTKPHHLNHIALRLEQLEAAYQDWSRNISLDHYRFDEVSVCSCTESCLNDDGQASNGSGLLIVEDQETINTEGLNDKALVEYSRGFADDNAVPMESRDGFVDEKGSEGKIRVHSVGQLCGIMMSGVLVGMALMGFVMARFSDFSQLIGGNTVIVTPT